MAQADLIPFNKRTEDEVKEMTRRGGVNSGKSRLAKKHGRELLQALLAMKEPAPDVIAEVAKSFGLDPKNVTKEIAMHGRQVDKAIRKADTKAYNAVNKAAGIAEEINVNGDLLVRPVLVKDEDQRRKLDNIADLGI